MKEVTRQMIEEWKMTNVDWMGYRTDNMLDYSFHHLIVPKRKHGPVEVWNGAILNRDTAHEYLHRIEKYDFDRYVFIQKMLLAENKLHRLDLMAMIYIDDCLKGFEREWSGKYTKKGKVLVKEKYIKRDYKDYFYRKR